MVEPGRPFDGGVYTLTELLGRGSTSSVYLADVDLGLFDVSLLIAAKQVSLTEGSRKERRRELRAKRKELRARPREELLEEIRREGIPYPIDGVCAVKILDDQDEIARTRFQVEWLTMLGFDHIRLVEVYGGGETDPSEPGGPQAYYAMEYLDGQLAWADVQKLSAPAKLTLIADAAAGLRAMHRQGLIHRDVKPESLIIYRQGNSPARAKVSGLGISVKRSAEALERGAAPARYRAPELASNADLASSASDVYGLGAIAYEMLTGVPPYARRSAEQILEMQRAGEGPTPPEELAPAIDERVLPLLRRMLAMDPAQRLADMGEVEALALDLAERVPAQSSSRKAPVQLRASQRRKPPSELVGPRAKTPVPSRRRTPSSTRRHRPKARGSRLPLVLALLLPTALVALYFLWGQALLARWQQGAASSSSGAPSSTAVSPPPSSSASVASSLDPEAARARALARRLAAQVEAADSDERVMAALDALAPAAIAEALGAQGARQVAPRLAALRRSLQAQAEPLADRLEREAIGFAWAADAAAAQANLERLRRWGVEELMPADAVGELMTTLADPTQRMRLQAQYADLIARAQAMAAIGPVSLAPVARCYRQLLADDALAQVARRLPADPAVIELRLMMRYVEAWRAGLAARVASKQATRLTIENGPSVVGTVTEFDDHSVSVETSAGARRMTLAHVSRDDFLELVSDRLGDQLERVYAVITLYREPARARAVIDRALRSLDREFEYYVRARQVLRGPIPAPPPWLDYRLPLSAAQRAIERKRAQAQDQGELVVGDATLTPEAFVKALAPAPALGPLPRPATLLAADRYDTALAASDGDLLVVDDLVNRQRTGCSVKFNAKSEPQLQGGAIRQLLFEGPSLYGVLAVGKGSSVFRYQGGARLHPMMRAGGMIGSLRLVRQGGVATLDDALCELRSERGRLQLGARGPAVPGAQLLFAPGLPMLVAGPNGLLQANAPPGGQIQLVRIGERPVLMSAVGGKRALLLHPEGKLSLATATGAGWQVDPLTVQGGGSGTRLAVHPSGLIGAVSRADGSLLLIDLLAQRQLRSWRIPDLIQGASRADTLAFGWRRLHVTAGKQLGGLEVKPR